MTIFDPRAESLFWSIYLRPYFDPLKGSKCVARKWMENRFLCVKEHVQIWYPNTSGSIEWIKYRPAIHDPVTQFFSQILRSFCFRLRFQFPGPYVPRPYVRIWRGSICCGTTWCGTGVNYTVYRCIRPMKSLVVDFEPRLTATYYRGFMVI